MTKLPELFTNTFNKKIDNSQEYTTVKEKFTEDKTLTKYELNKKINQIFKSDNYIYKINVDITLKNQIIKKTIIGKNSTHLITIDNELIPIKDIIDINESKK
ncbi:MAG: hypothetical protein IJD92_00205 [Bacilli bacterium]|nr:hypothetical protein [Bacilli bacterium]